MKVYISVDMEGMAGITAPFQEKEEVASFRRALHNQIRWIIDGIHESAVDGQVEEITIADSHGSGTNLSYDELSAMDERISLVSGSPRKHFMMSCLDETTGAPASPSPTWTTAFPDARSAALKSTASI